MHHANWSIYSQTVQSGVPQLVKKDIAQSHHKKERKKEDKNFSYIKQPHLDNKMDHKIVELNADVILKRELI